MSLNWGYSQKSWKTVQLHLAIWFDVSLLWSRVFARASRLPGTRVGRLLVAHEWWPKCCTEHACLSSSLISSRKVHRGCCAARLMGTRPVPLLLRHMERHLATCVSPVILPTRPLLLHSQSLPSYWITWRGSHKKGAGLRRTRLWLIYPGAWTISTLKRL